MRTTYTSKFEDFKRLVLSTGPTVDEISIEAAFESMYDWSPISSVESLVEWYTRQQASCAMKVEEIPLADCRGWIFDEVSGRISHSSGEFFNVHGVRVSFSLDREVEGGWDQPIIAQVGYDGGLLGLLRKRIYGVPHYLIEAKAEPGNPDKVQISPTLQATFSNLKQAHGGKKPRFAEYFEDPERSNASVLRSQWMSEDGGRLHLKRNKGVLVEIPEEAVVEAPNSFKWVSLFQLKHLIRINSWVNPHIRGIISSL